MLFLLSRFGHAQCFSAPELAASARTALPENTLALFALSLAVLQSAATIGDVLELAILVDAFAANAFG